MLLLVTIALVVVAFVLLVLGFVDHSLGLIYASIFCSVAAAVILIVVSRLSRRRALRLAPAGVTPGFGDLFAQSSPDRERSDEPSGEEDPDQVAGRSVTTPETAPAVEAGPGRSNGPGESGGLGESAAGEDDYVFPIEAYDELRAVDIIPLLVQLDPDELEEVRAWEMEGRARVSITRRIETLLRAAGIEPPVDQPSPAVPVDQPAEETEGVVAALFPIADYDTLRVADILPLLDGLSPSQLAAVEARETAGAGRTTVLKRVQRLLR